MPEQHTICWRNHIYNSFTEGCSIKAPLRFLQDGKEPELTILQMGSKSATAANEEKGKRKWKGTLDDKRSGKGRK
jgi:hypothetical protein